MVDKSVNAQGWFIGRRVRAKRWLKANSDGVIVMVRSTDLRDPTDRPPLVTVKFAAFDIEEFPAEELEII